MKKLLLLFLLIPFLSTAQIQVSTSFSYIVEKGFGNEANFAGSGFELSLRKHLSDKFRTFSYQASIQKQQQRVA